MDRPSAPGIKQIGLLLVPLFAMAFAATLAPASSASEKETAKWDQARVTSIAAKLPDAAKKLYQVIYDEGQPTGFGSGDAYEGLKQTARLLRSESEHLAKALQKGEGQDDTRHSLERISELGRDVAEIARDQPTTNPVVAAYATFEDLLRQLNPYYGL